MVRGCAGGRQSWPDDEASLVFPLCLDEGRVVELSQVVAGHCADMEELHGRVRAFLDALFRDTLASDAMIEGYVERAVEYGELNRQLKPFLEKCDDDSERKGRECA